MSLWQYCIRGTWRKRKKKDINKLRLTLTSLSNCKPAPFSIPRVLAAPSNPSRTATSSLPFTSSLTVCTSTKTARDVWGGSENGTTVKLISLPVLFPGNMLPFWDLSLWLMGGASSRRDPCFNQMHHPQQIGQWWTNKSDTKTGTPLPQVRLC